MNILFTGRGGSGSWQIRGVQVGAALGSRVIANATAEELGWADVIVAVKKIPGDLLARIRASGKPWVYDVIDAYPQPEAGAWSEEQAKRWVQTLMAGLEPDAVIWPTSAMQDCAPYMRGTVINHHYRPGIERNPIRPELKTIGYEGAPQYLGEWLPAFEKAAAKIGARFVINPERLGDVDVVVAVRGKQHNGWAQRMYKSNVKVANAQGSGTPMIAMPSRSYFETADDLVEWVMSPRDIDRALDALRPQMFREFAGKAAYKKRYSVEDAANDYRNFLCALKS